ncbi:MAG: condensation domain-containing protein, partial [Chromatiales bacterium]
MTAHEIAKPVHESVILSPTCQSLAKKRAMLKQLLYRKHRDETSIHAMSKGQEALWYVHQNAPDSAAYNVAMAFHVHASLDEDRLETALKLLMQRHEVLRTDYAVVDNRNVQRVHSQVKFSLHRVDAADLDERELHARIVSDYSRPFDLSVAPPLRAYHYRVTAQRGVMLLVVHHIAIDAASLWILMEELAEIYQALQRGEKWIRCQKSGSYQDFCRQQDEWVAGAQGRAARDYWKRTLAADAPPLTLDISRPRPAVQDHRGATHYFAIPSALAEEIKALAQREGVTHFATLLAAWTCLLSRHSGQEDICVVSPTSGRSHSEFVRSIGYFVNPVVIRTQLADNPTVVDFLRRVQQCVWETLEHQQFPFASVIEAVNPRRDSAITPYSQVSFVFQKAQGGAEMSVGWTPGQVGPRVPWAGMEVQQYPLDQQEGQFELELEVTDTGGRFYAIAKYCTALFDTKDIDALAARYIELLRSMVAQPDAPLGSLNMLTDAEQAQLAQWNATDFVYPPHRNLHELISAQVRRTPDAVALKFGDESMSYAYMNRQANRLAQYLVSQGVQTGTRVGVCMTRSFEMVLSLLAVLKAGAAYVPVDPTYPAERVAFLLRDMQAPLILSQAYLVDKMPELETRIVSVDRLNLDTYSDEDPSRDVGPDDLAYMIYTSGSTGNPKGAMN